MVKRIWIAVLAGALALSSLGAAMAQEAMEDIKVIVPERYEQTGTLPMYRMEPYESFLDVFDPAWLDQSDIVSRKNMNKRGQRDEIVFASEAELLLDASYVYYMQRKGAYEDTDDYGKVHTLTRPAFSGEVDSLAMDAHLPYTGAPAVLERTALHGVTLQEAEAAVQALLQKLGVGGFVLDYALDMSVERIRELGAQKQQMIEKGEYQTDLTWDYAQATAEDEAFYLHYTACVDQVPIAGIGGCDLQALVSADGVRYLSLLAPYAATEVYDTPDALVDAQRVLARVREYSASVSYASEIAHINSSELMYAPLRATKKQDGTVLTPVWWVDHTIVEPDGSTLDVGWAMYNALDGELICDMYRDGSYARP